MHRNFTQTDFEWFSQCMKVDPHHAELSPQQFLSDPKTETYVWEDEEGAVFTFRLSRLLRVDVQYDPQVSPERIRRGITEGVAWLQQTFGPNFREIVFDSVYRPLILFCRRQLGFKPVPDIRKFI